MLVRFFAPLRSIETLYQASVLPLPVPSSRLPVSGPPVSRDRLTLPMGSRKALVEVMVGVPMGEVQIALLKFVDMKERLISKVGVYNTDNKFISTKWLQTSFY